MTRVRGAVLPDGVLGAFNELSANYLHRRTESGNTYKCTRITEEAQGSCI